MEWTISTWRFSAAWVFATLRRLVQSPRGDSRGGWGLPIFALYATSIQRMSDVFVSSQKRHTRILDGSPGGGATCENHISDYSKLGERRFWYFFVSVKTRVISLSTYIVVV